MSGTTHRGIKKIKINNNKKNKNKWGKRKTKTMSEICPNCGLPKELCACDLIAKEEQKIIVRTEKRRFGKKYTIIEGLNKNDIDVKAILKKLKAKFACGGTYKDNKIELQGDHTQKAKQVLISLGFPQETITIKK